MQELLESMDKAVRRTIRGDVDSLLQCQTLWPQICQEIDPDLLEESREQYLRYAINTWQEVNESVSTRDASLALSAMEAISLLFGEVPQ